MAKWTAEDLERRAADLRRAANELRAEADRYKEPGAYRWAIAERELWAAQADAHARAIRECENEPNTTVFSRRIHRILVGASDGD